MEQLIPVINRLQDVIVAVGLSPATSSLIDLPQIAVVGSQSVGKSSVLESIVGRDFLPRGSGIVTRCPLILQLMNLAPADDDKGATEATTMTSSASEEEESSAMAKSAVLTVFKEWGEFGHTEDRKFTDFDEIRKEIERETERRTGTNKGLSHQPIMLKIYSPHVIDLTLIDLPGITKVPVGDQPSDIEARIRKMILSFITRPNCIILAVTAANTDLANSDALQMAREVDPEGTRTVGVLTKCDLMDDDTDAFEMLMGKVYPLKKGYVGVVCRSQKDINRKTSIMDAIRDEERFFRTHPAYRSIAHRCGTKYLSVLLNQILMWHIRETLPELKHRIASLIMQYEADLLQLGGNEVETQGNPGAVLLLFFSKFARNFQEAIDGRLSTAHSFDQLTGGARINYIFHDWFGRALTQFNPLDGLTDLEIRASIRNATGPKASLFIPEGAFELLVRKQIAKLEAPALQCVEQVYQELQQIVEKCELNEMARFIYLREKLLEVVRGVLKRSLQPTNQMIKNLIQMELAYFNTNHPDFVGGSRAISLENDATAAAVAASLLGAQQSQQQRAAFGMGGGYSSNPQFQQGGGAAGNTSGVASSNAHPSSNSNMPLNMQQQQHQAGGHSGGAPPRGQTGLTTNARQWHSTPSAPAPPLLDGPRGSGNNSMTKSLDGVEGAEGNSAMGTGDESTATNTLSMESGGGFASSRQQQAQQERSSYAGFSAAAAINMRGPYMRRSLNNGGWGMAARQSDSGGLANNSNFPSSNLGGSSGSHHCSNDMLMSGGGTGLRLPHMPSVVSPADCPTDLERTEIDLIKSLIISYFNIVRKNVGDFVPKAVMYFMVNTAKEVMQRELVAQLYKEDLFESLLKEGEEAVEARETCRTALSTLKAALDIVNQTREISLDEI